MSSSSSTSDPLVPGALLRSGASTYQVLSVLGQGCFGKVAKCLRMDNQTTVAVKMIKRDGTHGVSAKKELAAVRRLKKLDPDRCNLVEWNNTFILSSHICLEFELLDQSLYDFMKTRSFRPLPLKEIRPIIQQLANALRHLTTVGLIHTDLKPENIMLVNHQQTPYKVKLIDFGLAEHVSATTVGGIAQSLKYRSPEILLGLPYSEAIDMWSLGCVAAYLYMGDLLYPSRTEYDMMRSIVATQGQPPDHDLKCGLKTRRFFQKIKNPTTILWKLKTPEQFHRETGVVSQDIRKYKFSSLHDILHVQPCVFSNESSADGVAEQTDVLQFVDMLTGMLQLDATGRLTPRQVLDHPFITMSHIRPLCSSSFHARSCFDKMVICHEAPPKSPTVSAAVQQTSSSIRTE